jgi:thiamine biosynthesis lipoprotein
MTFMFRAMGTDVTVTADGGDEETVSARVAAIFDSAERRFSRFRADSELSALNRARGPMEVSAELFEALTRARDYVEMTNGLFDPGIGATLAAIGYDRSFAPGALDREERDTMPRAGSLLELVLDPETRTVERPEDVRIDLGGIIKGSTVDAAAACLPAAGAIDAGGDAYVRGRTRSGDAWLVEIEDPTLPSRTIATLAVSDAAVATSAPNRRFWRVAGAGAHHLIDPRTGSPVVNDLLQATVVAPRAELADVLAKTAFLLGSSEACRFLQAYPEVGGVLVRKAAAPLLVGALDVREVAHA